MMSSSSTLAQTQQGGAVSRIENPIDRGVNSVFIPKGTIFTGGTISYTQYNADNFKFLVLDALKTDNSLFAFRAFAAYTFADNVAAGLAFEYSQSVVKVDNAKISLGSDLNFEIKDTYSIQQLYTAEAFLRTYLNIGDSKRFGLYNDVRLFYGGGQGKSTSGIEGTEAYTGTFENITKAGIVIAPGISVFATDFLAVEAGIGILGVEYTHTQQITNQVYEGSFESFDASFKLNILSVRLGLTFYF